ncbi:MAG: hemerythrin domain-containing protein [Betaproteobacteria bacterium]|jgi:hemerythrin-like domain-containing protein|nr:hemerythrin domain-containing protein [Betaproteobacteria bacterium]
MQATDILSSEHRVIERVIAALDAAAERLDAGASVRPGLFLDAVRFIREFADGFHHGKEEGVLFEAMARGGMPLDDGPIGMMLYEHERGREITAGLEKAAKRLEAGEANAAAAVADHARAYGELLSQHIYKEDNILFPMADQAVVPQEQDTVLEEFARIERELEAKHPRQSYLDLARLLCAEAGLDPDAVAPRQVSLPCHAG